MLCFVWLKLHKICKLSSFTYLCTNQWCCTSKVRSSLSEFVSLSPFKPGMVVQYAEGNQAF